MFFPIGDENIKGGYKPIFSYVFLILNVLVFFYQFSLSPEACKNFLYNFGTIPTDIISGENYYSLLSNMFLHGGWMHLIGNMLFLWIFADNIEAIVGNLNFVIFYVMGGVIAALAHIYFNTESAIPAVGASGAISAVMGAYLVMFPKSKIKIIFILFLKTFYMSALLFLGIWFLQQMIYGIGSLGPASAQTAGTAWWAHIGGFVFGLIAGYIANRSYMKPGDFEEEYA